ncbi:MAG TPA: amidohydrolase family protein [Vicinamibacterales bacterium]|nr:amidohydrolase family protein [Vicinamibacterales bacterium]
MRSRFLVALCLALAGVSGLSGLSAVSRLFDARLSAQPLPALSPAVRAFVSVDAPVVALTHVRVIDGTGAPAKADQTLIIRDGLIAAVGDAATTVVPAGARVLDLTGRTVLPGFVMLHEHMFYPAGQGAYNEMVYSFPRLYLAGGATTIRTAGSMVPYADLNLKKWIDEGRIPGPEMDVTGPYLEGPGLPIAAVKELKDANDARRMVDWWADEGATSFKAYMHITRAELGAAIQEAHKRGFKLTGHLCSVTFSEAADLGIDDLEHGLVVSTDFVPDKQPDVCPPQSEVQASLVKLDIAGPAAQALIHKLVAHHVALTSTLTVFETFVPGRPPASERALDAMVSEARDMYLRQRVRIAVDTASPWTILFKKEMEFEHAFAEAGGLLVSGTDPTGYGGVVAGFSNQREVELLVEAGFTPLQAIEIATLNGARYLGRENRIGSIADGKQADLIVVQGDPSTKISDIEHVETVFKDGIGYDSQKLIAATLGTVGLR